MTEGKKLSYGKLDRQFVEVYSNGQATNKASPVLVFLHGGAWRDGATSDHHDLAQYISSNSEIVAILIEYRISAKEGPNTIYHPDHINDVYQALNLIFNNDTASQFNYDTSKVVFVGHSAGGYMVNAAALASDQRQTSFGGPIRDMPSLDADIRKSIRAFVAVECIFSLVDLVRMYPSYISFVQTAFYPPDVKPTQHEKELVKAGLEAWPVDASTSKPTIYVIHSSEDNLLNTDYNAQGIQRLHDKGLKPIIDLDSFKGDHDALLHTEAFWRRLVKITHDETNKVQ